MIYFFRGQGKVADNFLSTPPADVAIPAIAVYEVEVGIAKSTQPAKRRRQFDQLLDVVQVLPFDRAAADQSASVRAVLEKCGQPIGRLDTLIAGTTLAYKATLVTHNEREFSRVPKLKLEDWYK